MPAFNRLLKIVELTVFKYGEPQPVIQCITITHTDGVHLHTVGEMDLTNLNNGCVDMDFRFISDEINGWNIT